MFVNVLSAKKWLYKWVKKRKERTSIEIKKHLKDGFSL